MLWVHNICFGAKIREKNMPCIQQFCFIKVGFNGVYFPWTYFPDVFTHGYNNSLGVEAVHLIIFKHLNLYICKKKQKKQGDA